MVRKNSPQTGLQSVPKDLPALPLRSHPSDRSRIVPAFPAPGHRSDMDIYVGNLPFQTARSGSVTVGYALAEVDMVA